jgi:hypothetical protein
MARLDRATQCAKRHKKEIAQRQQKSPAKSARPSVKSAKRIYSPWRSEYARFKTRSTTPHARMQKYLRGFQAFLKRPSRGQPQSRISNSPAATSSAVKAKKASTMLTGLISLTHPTKPGATKAQLAVKGMAPSAPNPLRTQESSYGCGPCEFVVGFTFR